MMYENAAVLLSMKPGSRIVDLGCGNGARTAKLAGAGYDVVGVDDSPGMIALARKNYPDLPFILADVLDFRPDRPADAVVSSAVLNRIPAEDQDTLLANIAACLRVEGEFVFETGGRGNHAQIHGTLADLFRERGLEYRTSYYFPSIGDYTPKLERAGMAVDFSAQFKRSAPQKSEHAIIDWILTSDREPFGDLPETEIRSIAAEAETRLRSRLFREGVWYLDDVRLQMKARRRADPD